MKRNGRPPKTAPEGKTVNLTVKIPSGLKNQIVELADGYGLTITEYVAMLVERDASQA